MMAVAGSLQGCAGVSVFQPSLPSPPQIGPGRRVRLGTELGVQVEEPCSAMPRRVTASRS